MRVRGLALVSSSTSASASASVSASGLRHVARRRSVDLARDGRIEHDRRHALRRALREGSARSPRTRTETRRPTLAHTNREATSSLDIRAHHHTCGDARDRRARRSRRNRRRLKHPILAHDFETTVGNGGATSLDERGDELVDMSPAKDRPDKDDHRLPAGRSRSAAGAHRRSEHRGDHVDLARRDADMADDLVTGEVRVGQHDARASRRPRRQELDA